MIPAIIRNSRQQILDLRPLRTNEVRYEHKKWKRHLVPSARTYLEDIDNSIINRSHVVKAYRDFFNGSDTNPTHPFLLSMTWGYYNANNGAFRVNRLVAGGNRKLIRESLNKMKDRNVAAAFDALNSIPYMGMSYISKALYFVGRALNMKRYPLILDNRVAEALV
jgi:hypothetical protein